MSTDDREKRWMAYMDGQMSTSEALEFERSLSSREKDRLDGEVKLESAMCESLMGRECCPLALWNSLSTKMKTPAAAPSRKYPWVLRGMEILAAAVFVVCCITAYQDWYGKEHQVEASILKLDATDVIEFARESEVPPTIEAAQKFLDDNKINLQLVTLPALPGGHTHQVRFLGACRSKCKEKSIFELRFSCCGMPATLVVAPKGSEGARMIGRATRCGEVQDSREAGDYVTAVACGHDTSGLLNMLKPRMANLI